MSMVETGDCWDNGEFDILNLLDFPMESLECDDGYVGDWDNSNSQFLEPIPLLPCGKIETVPSYSSLGPVALINGSPERKPNYIKQSSASNIIQHDVIIPEAQESTVFQTESPISVLESSGSCSSGKGTKPTIPTRPRSKRARPTGSTSWTHLSPPLSSSKMAPNVKKNKEKMKNSREKVENCPRVGSSSDVPNGSFSHRPGLTKKCTHCEITKTPQWREGPLGPKTLCNACGVRFRSGRLFPEYRPAASPTFVPSLHSNSHKKVIEMRSKGKRAMGEMYYPPVSPQPEFVPTSNSMFDFMYN